MRLSARQCGPDSVGCAELMEAWSHDADLGRHRWRLGVGATYQLLGTLSWNCFDDPLAIERLLLRSLRKTEMAKHDPRRQPTSPEKLTPIERTIDGRTFRGGWRVVDNQMQVTLQGYDQIERGDVDRVDPESLAGIMFSTLINHFLTRERQVKKAEATAAAEKKKS